MQICTPICRPIFLHVNMCSYMQTYVCIPIPTCRHVFLHANLYTYVQTYIPTCKHVFLHANLHSYMQTCIPICKPTCIPYAKLTINSRCSFFSNAAKPDAAWVHSKSQWRSTASCGHFLSFPSFLNSGKSSGLALPQTEAIF
jgi:hypothetical protein